MFCQVFQKSVFYKKNFKLLSTSSVFISSELVTAFCALISHNLTVLSLPVLARILASVGENAIPSTCPECPRQDLIFTSLLEFGLNFITEAVLSEDPLPSKVPSQFQCTESTF